MSHSCTESGAGVPDNSSRVLLLITGDLLFPPPLLRIEKMLPVLRLPNNLNPFLIFPLDCDSPGGGSMFSVCTSIFSLCPPFFISLCLLLQLLLPEQWMEHLYPDPYLSLSRSLPLPLSVRFFISCLYPSLCLSLPSSPFSSISPLKAPPLCLVFFVWLHSLVAIGTEELSSFRQYCRARGCHQPTLNTAFSSSLSDDSVYINGKDKCSINKDKF